MPSRRSFLASASTLAAGSLAGCIGRDTRFSPAARTHLPHPPEGVARVGRVETEFGDDCPHGLCRATARAYETPGRLHLRTEFDCITGESGCATNWGNDSFAVRHRWAVDPGVGEGLAAAGSNVVPVDRGDAPFALAATQDRTHRRWTVRFTPERTSTVTLAFASTVALEESPEPGDLLGHVTADWRVSRGLLGRDRFGTELALRYDFGVDPE